MILNDPYLISYN
uniref:Uncharacterized protein n=1 Tax=Anguilla anguilla TaxID=7936 RepID=A0A0E9QVP6_ANGAN